MMTTDNTLGLYLHVPFCAAKCRYCDFYSAPAGAELRRAYVTALCRHMAATAKRAEDYTVDTVYIGGGTPTLLGAEPLAEMLATVRACYQLTPDAEITVECNPVMHTEGLFEGLLAAGVNRLSIGLQSACDEELSLLGRAHTVADFRHTLHAARAAGFENINVDIMLGIPDQTVQSLADTLDFVIGAEPSHISAYCLRVEEGTPFYHARHALSLPTDDIVADMQEQTAAALKAAGYTHYEVSNYAKRGRESRHNLRYWECADYLGFGPAAHSYFEGVRYAAPRSTADYIEAVMHGAFAQLVTDAVQITPHEAREEYVMLGMRLFEGVDEQDFYARFGISFNDAYGPIDRYAAAGLLTRRNGRIAFTERGMLVSNAILSEWLDFS